MHEKIIGIFKLIFQEDTGLYFNCICMQSD